MWIGTWGSGGFIAVIRCFVGFGLMGSRGVLDKIVGSLACSHVRVAD